MKRFASFAAVFFVASIFIVSCKDDNNDVNLSENIINLALCTTITYSRLSVIPRW